MSSNEISSLTSQIYKSRQTLIEIMGQQGYDVSDYGDFSINEVSIMRANEQLDMLLTKSEEDPDTKSRTKMWIRYYITKKLVPKNLDEMIEDLFYVEEVLNKNDTLFIIIIDEPNETLVEKIKHIWKKDGIFVIIQSLKRLQFNILNHILVPPHRILSISETLDVKHRYNIMNETQFPDISRFDPVAQAIGIRPGQVCKITRPSKTAITTDYYRICS